MLLFALACSSPTATVITAKTEGLPLLSGLDDYAGGKLQKSVQNCYAQALAEDDTLAGTVTVIVTGSHGILKVESEDTGPLAACVTEPLNDSRTQRSLGDGDNTVGAAFTVTFTP
ncbi:MAG: hypothetical protein GY913_32685 [Proteobacteria bacterium]|nr:hypothetical protein [Pseudomonadota bacterium]MCP4921680.1 hypothetical protein [Pseudomonadota bacterium]